MQHDAEPRHVPPDYDRNPERFRIARAVLRHHGLVDDVHERVGERLAEQDGTPVLDIGCGEGVLARHLPVGSWIGLDNARPMLARAPKPAVLGDARALPFRDGYFGGVAMLYVLYHLANPLGALVEARRVLRSDGLIVVAAPSRHDSPELANLLPRRPLTFDAELAPHLLGELFVGLEVDSLGRPLLRLPTRDAVRDFLIGKGVPAHEARDGARSVDVPLSITKRGALVFARKGLIL